MNDRLPTYPGRVRLTPVPGQDGVYDMTRADQPTQQGTPLNEANLLKKETGALFGLGADCTPDQAFAVLGQQLDYPYSFRVRVVFPNGSPVPGVQVSGIVSTSDNGAAVTDSDGYVTGKWAKANTTLGVKSKWANLQDTTLAVTSAGSTQLTNVTLTMKKTSYNRITVTESKDVLFSPDVTSVDVCAIGGGGSGAAAAITASRGLAQGGAGGYIVNQYDMSLGSDQTVTAIIGAGGESVEDDNAVSGEGGCGLNGKDGGTTTATAGGVTVTAQGGKAGLWGYSGNGSVAPISRCTTRPAGGGPGGGYEDASGGHNEDGLLNAQNGGRPFTDSTGDRYGSGGGGVYAKYASSDDNEPVVTAGTGEVGAGDSAYSLHARDSREANAGDATTIGSGGGAAYLGWTVSRSSSSSSGTMKSGAGMHGAVIVRWSA